MDRRTELALGTTAVIITVLIIMALYGWWSGAWQNAPVG